MEKNALRGRERAEKSNYARLSHSPRLQRVLDVLSDNKWHSTRNIIRKGNVCAVSSCIHELRLNGFAIDQRYVGRRSEYQLG